MSAGELKGQLAASEAEGAEHNERAIQASAQVAGLQTQVSVSHSAEQGCFYSIQNSCNRAATIFQPMMCCT